LPEGFKLGFLWLRNPLRIAIERTRSVRLISTVNREEKANKIKAVLSDFTGQRVSGKRILDVGTGNGEIAAILSVDNEVHSTDVMDLRKNRNSGVVFRLVDSEYLPYRDEYFDLVISNHVIEHLREQSIHLAEIHRVLSNQGACYLASPNRLFPWECHYNTFFIHYFGNTAYDKYLKRRRIFEGSIYLLSYPSIKRMIAEYFDYREYTHVIIKHPETFGLKIPLIKVLPLSGLEKLNIFSQTSVFVLRKKV